jgi:prevent-host-death family protein
MAIVSAQETRIHLSDLLNRVSQGEQITITRFGVPVALLAPVGRPAGKKEPKLTHSQVVAGMRELRKRVKPSKMSVREMIREGHT